MFLYRLTVFTYTNIIETVTTSEQTLFSFKKKHSEDLKKPSLSELFEKGSEYANKKFLIVAF